MNTKETLIRGTEEEIKQAPSAHISGLPWVEWSERWGIQLAYGITQDAMVSEGVLLEALLACVTLSQGTEDDFARHIVERALPQAFVGFSTDWFFRLPVRTRILSMLKGYGGFNSRRMCQVLQENEKDIDDLLELSRLAFTSGKSWLAKNQPQSSRGHDCPDFADGRLFARYLGNDLEWRAIQDLHKHFVVCTYCRQSLQAFKTFHQNWLWALPQVEVSDGFAKLVKKTVMTSRRFSAQKQTRQLRAHARLALAELAKDPLVRGMTAVLTILLIFKAAGIL